MLGSVGFGELLLIGIVALIVFGPQRLPEIARKAGQLMAQARRATREFTDALDAEYEGASSPLRELQNEYEFTKRQLTDSVSKLTDMTGKASPETSNDDAIVESGDDGSAGVERGIDSQTGDEPEDDEAP
jgi:sec-independent protein translocase protein TatB